MNSLEQNTLFKVCIDFLSSSLLEHSSKAPGNIRSAVKFFILPFIICSVCVCGFLE